ncbi:MAG: hypothetical protein R3E39_10735 [Anaerolineae bacterium]
MSNKLMFYLLPFDPQVMKDAKIRLPINLSDFIEHLQKDFSTGKVTVDKLGEQTVIGLYITTEKNEPWVVANLTSKDNTVLEISGWPKGLAKKLILWYRQYIDKQYPLFLVVSFNGNVHELTEQTSPEDIESLYPYPVPED